MDMIVLCNRQTKRKVSKKSLSCVAIGPTECMVLYWSRVGLVVNGVC